MTMEPSAVRESLRMMGYFRGRGGVQLTDVPGTPQGSGQCSRSLMPLTRRVRSRYYEGLHYSEPTINPKTIYPRKFTHHDWF